jgi:hypothetical protein
LLWQRKTTCNKRFGVMAAWRNKLQQQIVIQLLFSAWPNETRLTIFNIN